jgi:cadmium resistance protein CadD (predicted permease)
LEDDLSDPNSSLFLIEALSVASVAAISYVSTNFDNLVVLSAYGAKPGYRPLYMKLTFICVCVTVLFVSLMLAQAADNSISAKQMRYLGLIPIALGGYQLLKLMMNRVGGEDPSVDEGPVPIGFATYFGFALVLLANSSDSVSIMTPLLADLKPLLVPVSFAAAVVMAILMTWLAKILAHHPASRAYLEKIAKWALPFLLIGIGVLIITDEPSDIFLQ